MQRWTSIDHRSQSDQSRDPPLLDRFVRCQFYLHDHLEAGVCYLGAAVIICRLSAWVLAAVLTLSGLGKILDPLLLRNELLQIGLLPRPAALLFADWIPWLELCTSCALIIPTWQKAGGQVAAVFGLGLALFSGVAWAQNWSTHCGCFGSLPVGWGSTGWGMHLFFALMMTGLAVHVGWQTSAAGKEPQLPTERR